MRQPEHEKYLQETIKILILPIAISKETVVGIFPGLLGQAGAILLIRYHLPFGNCLVK
jgi:hypothetical protein